MQITKNKIPPYPHLNLANKQSPNTQLFPTFRGKANKDEAAKEWGKAWADYDKWVISGNSQKKSSASCEKSCEKFYNKFSELP